METFIVGFHVTAMFVSQNYPQGVITQGFLLFGINKAKNGGNQLGGNRKLRGTFFTRLNAAKLKGTEIALSFTENKNNSSFRSEIISLVPQTMWSWG